MRMKRKHHLDERMIACKEYWVETSDEPQNFNDAVKNPDFINLKEVFDNDNPVELDIGCGLGQFVCESAKQHPEKNFFALERITNVLIAAIERAKKDNIKNAKFICTNAACLNRYFKEHTISRIYLNFSNPLPKKGYAKKRLTNEKFLLIYKNILIENGEIFMKTDDKNFFEYSMEELKKCGFSLRNISFDLHKSNMTDNIITEHEKKFSDMGLPIYRLEAYLK